MKQKIYQIVTANRVLLGEKVTEFRHFKLVSVDFLELNNYKIAIDYKLLHQKMEDTALIHRWMTDIEEFQKHLILSYNTENETIHLNNYNELVKNWKITKPKLRQKYQSKGVGIMIDETEKVLFNQSNFEKHFSGYNAFRTLLNPYYSQKKGKHELNLENFFGSEISLNLLLTSQKTEENKLHNLAEINQEIFDKKALTKMLRNITHTMDLKPEINIDMEEIYIFNQDHTPKEVNLYLDVAVVDGFYHTTMAHQLVELSQNEMLNITLEWKKEKENQQSKFSFLA